MFNRKLEYSFRTGSWCRGRLVEWANGVSRPSGSDLRERGPIGYESQSGSDPRRGRSSEAASLGEFRADHERWVSIENLPDRTVYQSAEFKNPRNAPTNLRLEVYPGAMGQTGAVFGDQLFADDRGVGRGDGVQVGSILFGLSDERVAFNCDLFTACSVCDPDERRQMNELIKKKGYEPRDIYCRF